MNAPTALRSAIFLAFVAGTIQGQSFTISTFAGGAPPATPGRALEASIGGPQAIVVDGAGNAYFNGVNAIFRLDPGGTLTLVAGNSRRGFSGDGGPATQAQLSLVGPYVGDELDYSYTAGLAVSPSGDLYIADNGNSRVRKVSQGIITTVAGGGDCTQSCDGRLATDLNLIETEALASDAAGNLYILTSVSAVYKVSPLGLVTTVATRSDGTGAGFSTIALDAAGNLYLAQAFHPQVLRKTPDGTVTVVAGTGVAGYSGDGGPATAAQLVCPISLFVDPGGNLFIGDGGADNVSGGRVRRVSPDGVITTPAAAWAADYLHRGTLAYNFSPWGIALDANGNLLVADEAGNRIRSVPALAATPAYIFTDRAGNGTYSYAGDGGPATQALFAGLGALAFDSSGNLYLADYGNYRVRRITPNGVVTTIAGTGMPGYSGDGGPAISAEIGSIGALAVDAAGNLYLADAAGATVRKVAPDGTISTLAGTGAQGYSGDGGPAAAAQLGSPQALAVDAAGNVLIACFPHLRKVTPDGVITTIANPAATSLAIDAAGNIYASISSGIVKITPGGTLLTVTGPWQNGQLTGIPGPVASASVGTPSGLAFDSAGNLYITSSDLEMIFRLGTDGIIEKIAGSGYITSPWFGRVASYAGDGGPANSAQLSPGGIAVDARGNVYVADTANSAVRLLTPDRPTQRRLPR